MKFCPKPDFARFGKNARFWPEPDSGATLVYNISKISQSFGTTRVFILILRSREQLVKRLINISHYQFNQTAINYIAKTKPATEWYKKLILSMGRPCAAGGHVICFQRPWNQRQDDGQVQPLRSEDVEQMCWNYALWSTKHTLSNNSQSTTNEPMNTRFHSSHHAGEITATQ